VSGGQVPPFSRAVERQHRYGRRKLAIYFEGLQASSALQAVKAGLAALPVEAVEDISLCRMQIRESGGKVMTLAADSTTLSTPIPVSDPNFVGRVSRQVRAWVKWFNTLSLTNPQAALDIQFRIKASQTKDPFARVGKPDAGLLEGEQIEATVQNNSVKDLYI